MFGDEYNCILDYSYMHAIISELSSILEYNSLFDDILGCKIYIGVYFIPKLYTALQSILLLHINLNI